MLGQRACGDRRQLPGKESAELGQCLETLVAGAVMVSPVWRAVTAGQCAAPVPRGC